ncbi:MAG: hypothetical protein CMO82_11195 [Winogradskyella sp.]|nr:hypothetical protein [Winogradskyella sp.]|tara:strand:- start:527 stop:718 length:192 start_codon:yes stop_codon:yes gene_type:complete
MFNDKNKIMYAQINTRLLKGIFKVNEIIGGIVSVDNNGTSYDCYLKSGEVERFCTKDGKNFIG